MRSVGDCFDNALMESFWARMQVELLDGGDGAPASSWPTLSSNTSKSSTTGNDATPPLRTPIEYDGIHHDNNLTVAPLTQVS